MLNRELFNMDPREVNLRNEGVAKVRSLTEKDDLAIAEYELRTFVCEGEYHEGLRKLLENYLRCFDQTEQPVFWVSGFYGSGKSHLVKMAAYLWDDVALPGGKTARTIKPLPQDIQDMLSELSRKQKRFGKLAIAGTLRDFPSRDIRYSFLQLLLNALDLPPQYHHFKFVHWAMGEGIYDNLKALVEAKGKEIRKEIENLFVSPVLARAVLELMPGLAENESKLRDYFRAQFVRVEAIGREDFVRAIRDEILPLHFSKDIPCTIIVLDEIQQFIGTNADLANDVQFLAEDLSSRFDGRFLLVGTGQNALTDTSLLQKLMARFRISIQLSNTDIQTVIRKTILEKKTSAVKTLNDKMEQSLGEISRNLHGTAFQYLTEDRPTLVADYPILPSTRKFWYKVLQVIDVAGTSGQLRNQLRIIDDSLKFIADKQVGKLVPADFIFNQNQTQLIQSGLLLNDISNLIQERKAKGGDTELEGRILSAVFLLDQVTSNTRDTGIKSNEAMIADLLMDDLNTDTDALRSKVKELVRKLVDEKALMQVGDEVKLQTKIGAEWEQEFQKQRIKLINAGEDQVYAYRKNQIESFFRETLKGISVTQGVSRTVRDFEIWYKDAPPNIDQRLHLWLRDGWNENESKVMDEIRAAGNQTSLAYVFIKKFRDQELKTEIVNYLATGKTIEAMGYPSTPEGEQAKKSMETRQAYARTAMQELIHKICVESQVYLAGGNIVQSGNIRENALEALSGIAERQYPEFRGKADSPNWGTALTKALSGNPQALEVVGYKADVDRHPVATEILRFIGNGSKTGKEIRLHFESSPYGWPQDPVDTLLVMLRNTEFLSCSEPELNVGKIKQAQFKKEVHILSAKDKIGIKKLFQEVGIQCPPNKEIFALSNEYLNKLKSLASRASGDAPRPEPINIDMLRELENLEGNERLLEIIRRKDDLQTRGKEWERNAALVDLRAPLWDLLAQLAEHAPEDDELDPLLREVEAIRYDRLLLHEPDPIQPKLTALSEKLMIALNARKQEYIKLYDALMKELQGDAYFSQLKPEDKHTILVRNQILAKPEIKAVDATALLNQLNKVPLDAWQTRIAALTGQFQAAREEAIKLLAPKAKSFSLPRTTLNTAEQLEKYLGLLKKELTALLKEGGSVILK